jgi:type I restriction enzyme S subunit
MGNDNISLKYLVEITKGKKPKYEIDVYSEGLIPYLSMDYLRGKNLSPIYVDETKDSIVRVNNNDLLILWDGSKAGEIVYGKEGALSSTMAKIDIVSSKVTKAYLTYFLIHSQADIQGNTVGMGIPHVNGEDLKNLSVYLSSKQTQIRIAEFLDKKTEEINAIIEKKEAILLRLEEKKKSHHQ